MTDNDSLRQQSRQQRQSLSPQQRKHHSESITQAFLASTHYANAKYLAVYLPLSEEVNTHAIIHSAWGDNKRVYLPVVSEKASAMNFAEYTADSILTTDVMGMSIPDISSHEYLSATQLDTAIVPLVAFDKQGNRIGMGGGYYDRTFAFLSDSGNHHTTLIGVAFECQKIERGITRQKWDIPLKGIFTEDNFYRN